MFIKQINEKTALELAAKGREVIVLVPRGKGTEMGKHDAGHVAKDAGRLFVLPEGAGDGERRD